MPVIEARDVHFKYAETPVLKKFSFVSKDNEILGIIGPNGSGKTTLLKIIDGICKPQRGSVLLNQNDLNKMTRTEIARKIAFVPQDAAMVFSFTVEEVVMMGRSPHISRFRFESKKDADITRKAMKQTKIEQFAGRSINELSGGERQRVFIARALAQEPRIMLLDESAAFLDINHQISFFELLRMLNREEGVTVMVVTHDINMASLYCDRVMLLKDGMMYGIGTPHQVITKKNIEEVYGTEVLIDSHPIEGLPRMTLLSRRLSD
ncbi:MAG: ABC transporter ATP-binding protein [Syntrophales bacterium]|jgi:iron complex transport system ATP-binding protein|nr:ABC transporter ATP-binding protein [Syntrophales bacterium]